MKRLSLFILSALMCVAYMSAQKFALIDMEYILKNVPSYEMANEQLNQLSQRWQKEVETLSSEAETLYKNYQAERVFLTDEQKKKKPANLNTNTSVRKANCTKSVRHLCSRSVMIFTLQ